MPTTRIYALGRTVEEAEGIGQNGYVTVSCELTFDIPTYGLSGVSDKDILLNQFPEFSIVTISTIDYARLTIPIVSITKNIALTDLQGALEAAWTDIDTEINAFTPYNFDGIIKRKWDGTAWSY
jgi:hypothetical protein